MGLKQRLKDAWKKGTEKAGAAAISGNPYGGAHIVIELAKALKKPKNDAKTAP